MSILGWLGLGQDIAPTISAVGDLYTTDKSRLDGEQKLQVELNKPILAQMSNNAILASSSNIFNSGWQPLIGWTSGLLILLYYAPQIFIATYVWGSHSLATGICGPFPIQPDDILNLIYLLFGFGTHSIVSKSISKK